MSVFKKIGSAIIRTAVNVAQGNGLSQESNRVEGDAPVAVDASSVLRRAAAEGIVLLHNDGVLPLGADTRVALFGRVQYDWFYVGYGSGGDVNAPYRTNLLDAAEGRICLDAELADRYRRWCSEYRHAADEGFWGAWPRSHPEMPLSDADVAAAASRNDVAVYVIGRSAGEDRENVLKQGAYYLTSREQAILASVTRHFARTVVVLDIGNVPDMEWITRYRPTAVVAAWFGGQESCPALVDVLTGAVNPSGKLTDTIAYRYTDYPSASSFGNRDANSYREDIYVGYRYFETFAPDRVMYPFGYGLTYTRFDWQVVSVEASPEGAIVTVDVRNVGELAGREVMQMYVAASQGLLGKSARSLVAFAKTPLLAAGESVRVTLSANAYSMASFDDEGVTGYLDSYVLEAGTYRLLVGTDVRTVREVAAFELDATRCLQTLSPICPVRVSFDRMRAVAHNGALQVGYRPVAPRTVDMRRRMLDNLPPEVVRDDRNILWPEVLEGRASLAQFVRQLSLEELEALTRGEGFINSRLGVVGSCGAMGGVIPELHLRGVPPVIVCDGPSGLRLRRYCNLLPSGVCLAATWDPELVQAVYAAVGDEMLAHGVHVLLGPGMNIHRNPLCGRNFEYLSEDPLLTGVMAAGMVKGVQGKGVAACIKHFCCNNQEVNRNRNDSRVSQRALREIYLKGYEICIHLSDPWTLMTSYNLVNGVWCHYHYDLATTVLRQEWGYRGLIMTDWWMQHDHCHEFVALRDNAYRVRAGVDVFMPGSFDRTAREYRADDSLLSTVGQPDGLRRAEIERAALSTLYLIERLARTSLNFDR